MPTRTRLTCALMLFLTPFLSMAEQKQALSSHPVPPDGLVVVFSKAKGEDFSRKKTGYQDVVGLTLKKYKHGVEEKNWTPGGPVAWTVVSHVSLPATVWRRDPSAKHGLMWVESEQVPGDTDWESHGDAIIGAVPDGPSAALADVVGSRVVKVKAAVNGEFSAEAVFAFGPGPLSVFSKTSDRTEYPWATQDRDNTRDKKEDGFQSPSNTFPAASFCGGSVGNTTVKTYRMTRDLSGFYDRYWIFSRDWSLEVGTPGRARKIRHAKRSQLPTAEQLIAISRYKPTSGRGLLHADHRRKGAASAAGWPSDTGRSGSRFYWLGAYWTNEADFDGVRFFSANYVILDTGDNVPTYLKSPYSKNLVACVG